jgi:hypothetical protein
MKKTKLVASCLAVGIFAISASVQAAPRVDSLKHMNIKNMQIATPLGERVVRPDRPSPAGPGLVWENVSDGTSFFPQDPNSDELQAMQRVAEDMILAPGDAREISSYFAWIHQRSAEGPAGFTGHLSLYTDDGGGVESLPDSEIDGASCSIPDMHGLGRPDEAVATCIPNPDGDSGIIIPDKTWLQVVFEGGCTGTLPEPDGCLPDGGGLGPGWLIGLDAGAGGDPTVGSTEETFALCQGDICILAGFAGAPAFNGGARAGVPAPVPTVSEWGMVLIAMLVLTGGTIVLRRSRRSVATA